MRGCELLECDNWHVAVRDEVPLGFTDDHGGPGQRVQGGGDVDGAAPAVEDRSRPSGPQQGVVGDDRR
jgi:hypothetical protein